VSKPGLTLSQNKGRTGYPELSLKAAFGRPRSVKAWVGKPSALEKYYVYAFLLSILLGIVFGFINQSAYYAVNASLPTSTSAFDIFFHNFRNDILFIVTGEFWLCFPISLRLPLSLACSWLATPAL
jgi:hypothetical protein